MFLTHMLDNTLALRDEPRVGHQAGGKKLVNPRHHLTTFNTYSKSSKHSLCRRSWQTSLGTSIMVVVHSCLSRVSHRVMIVLLNLATLIGWKYLKG